MKKIKRHYLVLALFFLLFGLFLAWLNTSCFQPYSVVTSTDVSYERAKVMRILENQLEIDPDTSSGYRGTQQLEFQILSGEQKGEVVTATNYLTRSHNILGREGARLVLCIERSNNYTHYSVFNYSRSPMLYLMVFLLLAMMVVVGDWKGFKSSIALLFTFACVLFFVLPMIFNGYSPVWTTILSVVLISAVTLVLIDGVSKKTMVAFAGTSCGVVVAGAVFTIFSAVLHISGFTMDDVETMLVISQNTGLQLKHVLFAGVLIASLGAVIDMAMSIASSLYEIHEKNPGLPAKELFKSGMNVGSDMIGTMATTLILAYTGGSFGMLILLFAYSVNYNQVINMDFLVIEVAQAISGSMGIILTVPIVAFLGARFFHRQQPVSHDGQEVMTPPLEEE